jgi:PadR family transcriptional regulator, regulatory protein PadR
MDSVGLGNSENNQRANFYSLTRSGKKQLRAELESWARLSTAVGLVFAQASEVSA